MAGKKLQQAARINEPGTPVTTGRSLIKPRHLLVLSLWLIAYAVFIALEWGAVYFIVSLLAMMVWGTSSKPRKAGKKSAYSVFNPNLERIDGQLDASTIEKEIRRQLY